MKHVKFVLACLLALCVILPVTAGADTLDEILERGSLRVGMEPGYMPFEMTNTKGEIIGFDVDMMKRIARAEWDTLLFFYYKLRRRFSKRA